MTRPEGGRSREDDDVDARLDHVFVGVEADEASLASLPRLVFGFNKRDHGRMRMLIDYLNQI